MAERVCREQQWDFYARQTDVVSGRSDESAFENH